MEFRIARVRQFSVYVAGFRLEDRCRSLWVVEVVELFGHVTCERVVYRHGAILLILRVRFGFNARRSRWSSEQRTGRSERKRRGTRDRGRRQNKETTNAQTCDDMWMNMFYADTLCDTLMCTRMKVSRKSVVWGCSVHTPRHLQWIAIDCKRNQL